MNRNPRALRSLGGLLASGERFVLMDIGARGGVSEQWKPIADLARVIGFEPDRSECDRLNAAGSGMEFHPRALHSSPGEHVFYLTESDFCHGFRPCDPKYFGRFPNAINNRVRGEMPVRADSLDNFAADAGLDHIDFIKIDTEGSEPSIDSALSVERLWSWGARLLKRLIPRQDGAVLPFDEYWSRSERLFLDNCLAPDLRPKARIKKPRYRGSRDS